MAKTAGSSSSYPPEADPLTAQQVNTPSASAGGGYPPVPPIAVGAGRTTNPATVATVRPSTRTSLPSNASIMPVLMNYRAMGMMPIPEQSAACAPRTSYALERPLVPATSSETLHARPAASVDYVDMATESDSTKDRSRILLLGAKEPHQITTHAGLLHSCAFTSSHCCTRPGSTTTPTPRIVNTSATIEKLWYTDYKPQTFIRARHPRRTVLVPSSATTAQNDEARLDLLGEHRIAHMVDFARKAQNMARRTLAMHAIAWWAQPCPWDAGAEYWEFIGTTAAEGEWRDGRHFALARHNYGVHIVVVGLFAHAFRRGRRGVEV